MNKTLQNQSFLFSPWQKKVINTTSIAQWIILFLLVIYLVWVIPKGIDTFDEGVSLLHANPSQVQIFEPMQSGPLINLFVDYNKSTMMTYRKLKFVLLLSCGCIFAIALFSVVRRYTTLRDMKNFFFMAITPCIVIAGLSGYVFHTPTINYNNIAYCLIALIVSTSLLGQLDNRSSSVYWLIAGMLFVLLAYIKWPSAVAIFTLFIVSQVSQNTSHIALKVSTLILGIVAGYFIQQYLYADFISKAIPETKAYLQFAEKNYSSGLADSLYSLKDIFSADSYIRIVLNNYYKDALKLLKYLISGKFILIMLISALFIYLYIKTPKLFNETGLKILLSIGSAITAILIILEIPQHSSYSLVYTVMIAMAVTILFVRTNTSESNDTDININTFPYYILTIAIICGFIYILLQVWLPKYLSLFIDVAITLFAALIVIRYRKSFMKVFRNNHPNLTIICITLLLAPFCIGFGHDGGFVVHLIFGLPFWCGAIIILSIFFIKSETKDIISPGQIVSVSITSLILSSFIASQIIFSSMFNAYHMPTTLLKQNHAVSNMPKLSGIKLDATRKEFFDRLGAYTSKNGNVNPFRPILAVGDFPTLVFALSAFSPAHLWYSSGIELHYGHHNLGGNMCDNLLDSINYYGLPSILIPSKYIGLTITPDCLRKIGFPDKYVLGIELDWLDHRVGILPIRYYVPVD